jgi:hypothetical protein
VIQNTNIKAKILVVNITGNCNILSMPCEVIKLWYESIGNAFNRDAKDPIIVAGKAAINPPIIAFKYLLPETLFTIG